MKPTVLAMFLLLCCAVGAAEDATLEALAGTNGTLHLSNGQTELCSFNIGLFEKDWKGISASAGSLRDVKADQPLRKSNLKLSNGAMIAVEATLLPENGGVSASYQFTPLADVELNSLNVSAEFPVQNIAGGKWSADEKSGVFPQTFKDVGLFSGEIRTLKLDLPQAALTLVFSTPCTVLLQDNRQWGPTFSVRIGNGNLKLKKGTPVKFGFQLTAAQPIHLGYDAPFTITAGHDWVPLKLDLEIEPHSALDFSEMGFHDAPAGKFGRVIARPDGQFAFEKDAGNARRFYGVNFCFSANYISHEQSDKIAERLMRLGYNAVRIHHYEGELSDKQSDSLHFNPEKLDQLDYLLAAFAKRGIYITTDMFVSRQVKWKDLGSDKPGNVEMDTFKIMVPVHPGAWENWKSFTKTLLDHVNPYTKLRYADDPALAWLSMINEGMFANFLDRDRKVPEWTTAWNTWLAKQYASREALALAWKNELKENEDFTKGSVALPANIYASGARVRDCVAFFSYTDRGMIERMTHYLRDELGCKALITNSNAWTNHLSDQASRSTYDYVDDHFYVDHPQFLEGDWRLPSRCPNTSPISGGATGGRNCAFTRLFDKPFTITEFNYAAPGRFRGVGGILTGAMGALQGWSAEWRFAYSHSRDAMFTPGKLEYFNMVSDPLSQAAERASFCLFLRGDMKPAPHSIAVVTTPAQAMSANPMPHLAPAWNWMAWVTRVGTEVLSDDKGKILQAGTPALLTNAGLYAGDDPRAAGAANIVEDVKAYGASEDQLMGMLKTRGILSPDNPTSPAKHFFKSETGEITIDGPHDMLVLDTPKTAGGYARAGQTIATADGGVTIAIAESDATVWISALDNQPISTSNRLLVTHLTDLQNTDIQYAEKARQTLLDWGKLPHLVRNGQATLRVKLKDADKFKVWALATSGKRLAEVKAAAANGVLEFVVDVSEGAQEGGARMLYEVGLQ